VFFAYHESFALLCVFILLQMTVFEANRIFNGIACPYCSEKITINFNSDNLFAPFIGFIPENHRECCSKFHEQLNGFLSLHGEGRISESQLVGELVHYK
jgi:hypothetical protein